MKAKIYLLFLLTVFVFGISFSQNKHLTISDTSFFNYAYWNGVADKQHMSKSERAEMIAGQKNIYLEQLHQHIDEKNIFWVSEAPSSSKGYGSNTINAGPCTNIDFESGTFAGWTRSTGYNPLTNAIGCCPSPNGDQTIVSGAGVDPFGGFPIVYPGSGSFSLRLGSTAIGGIADRISQTFFVTPANANFTYRYAAVLNDGGHILAQQPRFTSEIIDTLGHPVNCTFYQVSAGSGVTGYVTSSLQAASNPPSPVIFKNWTNVAIDLSPNIGQNVTLRFTVYDCSPTGHFAYAYIDGLCTNFATSIADTTCPNVPIGMCAPAGFSTTTWNGPGVVNDPNQCISVSIPGTYTCTTILVPGCPGPTFTHTLTTLPNPVLSFTPATSGVCATQYTFNSTMSIGGGSLVSHTWDFGDGTSSASVNPVHTYATSGTYPVKLKATSNRGCMDSVVNFITIFPFPNLVFSPPSNCINTVVQFTNTSSIGVGSISGYTWTLGNGPTSNLINPTNTYTANGTYTINLTAASNQGCVSNLTQTLGIFPPPIISFSANPLCDINGTSFSPSTSTAIASGSLAIYSWDFGDGGTSTQANPIHIYSLPGAYTVSFTAISNHNCTASTTNTFIISPSPTVAFVTTSVNACSPNFSFTNNSGIAAGSVTYTWSFGGTNTTTAVSPSYTFPSIGDYTVSLIGVSNMGCQDTAIQYISVYPYPVINFSVPASCENAIFTVSTTAVSGSVTSYHWDFGDPLSGAANTSTLQDPTHFYSSTNNYTITLNLLSNLNCPSTTITPITVFPNPLASFSYSTLNNCTLPYAYINSSSVSAIGASSIVKNKWSFDVAGTSILANPGTVNFPANGSYSVSLIVTTNHNCSDTMSSNILVYPLPQLSFTANSSCLNLPVAIPSASFISSVPAPGSIGSYTWNLGDNTFTNTLNQAPHSYTASGIYTLTLGGTSNMGCVASTSKTIEILPIPVMNFTTTSNMCLGFTTLFSSTNSVSSGTIYALNWNFGDGTTGSNQNTTHTYSTSGNFNVKLYATTNNECTDTLRKTVTIFPLPTVIFTASNTCVNTLILFNETSTVVPTGSITSWNWNFGDGNSSGAQATSHTYTNYAIYTASLTVTSDKGCVMTGTNNINIYPLPNISFSPPGNCVNTAIQFTNTSSIPIGTIPSYVWDFSDGTGTVNVTSPLHTFTAPAVYVVTVTATSNQGCIGTAANNLSVFPYPSVSITPINSSCINQSVSIYPNVTITGINNPISGYTLSFGDGSPAFTSTSALQYTVPHLYTGYNTYTVSLSAISNGCSTSTTTTLKVYPNPFTNFVSNNFCLNDNTQFVNTSTIATTYSIQAHIWDFGDGAAPQSTLQNTSHIFSAPGTFSVNLTEFSFPEPGLTCSLSTIKNVTIHPIPTPSFFSNTVCAGLTTTLTNTTPSTSPTQTVTGWSWYFYNNGVLNSSALNPTFTYSASGTQSTMLKAVNNFGCKDSIINPVTIWAKPVVSFSINNSCLHTASNFTESSVISNTLNNSLATWNWQFGDGSSPSYSNTQNPSHTYTLFGTYIPTLTVTSNNGCTSSITSSLNIYPIPSVTFSPPGACVNSAIQFTNGTSIALGSISSYVWDFNDTSPTSTLTTPIHTYTNASIYIVTLTATSNQGCVSTGINTLSIHPYPAILITTLGSKCVNDFVVISPAVSITGVNNAISGYTVSFGDGSPAFITASPLQYTVGHTYPTFNTYTVNIDAISNGCATTASATIKIHPNPFTNFVSSKYCFKDSTLFVNTSTIAAVSSISDYLWNFNDGATSTSTVFSPHYSFTGVGVHNVSLTASSYPEVGLTCSVTAVKSITINPLPPAVAFTSNSVCLGNATQFTNSTPTTGITGWSWFTNNNQLFSISTNPVYTYTNNGKFIASLIALNNFGCRDTVRDTVRVFANPTASFVTNNVCFGNQSIFSGQSPTLAPADGSFSTYTWSTNGNTGFAFSQDAVFPYQAPGTYTVEYNVGSTKGCIGKYIKSVTVYPLPSLNFTATEVCKNIPIQFVNQSSILNGSIASYLWSFNDPAAGTNSTSVLINPTHLFPTSGSFATTLEAVSDNGCQGPPKVLNVLVHGDPVADFTHTTICVGDKLTFANLSSSSDGTIVSNQWDFNGDNTVDQDSPIPVYTYTIAGNFNARLKVITQFGCWDTVLQQVLANPKAIPIIGSDNKSGCPSLCVNFQNLSTIASGSFSTLWDFGDGSPANTFTNASNCYNAGTYDVGLTMISTAGCTTRFVHPGYVSVYPLPVAGFKVEPEEIDEDEPIITVSNQASPDASFIKYYINDGTSFGSPNFTHDIKNLKQTKPMVVQIVSNKYGCSDTIFQVLNIKPAYVVYFPDVFTPNGDGTNDDFRPKGVGILKFNMQIFDRWDNQVFHTTDITDTWDGRTKSDSESIKEDVYTWKAQVTDVFNKNHFLVGRVAIIR